MFEVVIWLCKEENEAIRLMNKLKKANIETTLCQNGKVFKVLYNVYDNKKEAEIATKLIEKIGFTSFIIYNL